MHYVAKKMTEGKKVVAIMIKDGGKMPPVHKTNMCVFATLCKM